MAFMDEFQNGSAPGISADRLNEPFHLKSVTYDAANDRLVLVMGRGRETFGPGVVVSKAAEETVYLAAPVVNTTYYLYLASDGAWLTNTTGGAVAGAVLLWSIQVGATKDTLAKTDLRPLLGVGDARKVAEELAVHTGDMANPHQTDAAQVGAVAKGAGNQDVEQVFSLLFPRDTRSLVATAWDANYPDKPMSLEYRDGATVVATVGVTYNADGHPTQIDVTAGGVTIRYSVSWTGDRFNSYTKAVV